MPYKEAEEEVERIMDQVDKNSSNAIDYTGIFWCGVVYS